MELLFYILLFIFGTMFGSFASVIIYRIRSGESGMFVGRSHCGKCERILGAVDLIPIVSFLVSKGECRKCKQKISIIYPFLEVSMGLLFAGIGYFLIDFFSLTETTELIKLAFLLILAFITIIYIYYDILFLEIPESILILGIIVTLSALSLQTINPEYAILEHIISYSDNFEVNFYAMIFSIVVIGGLYMIMLNGFHELTDSAIIILIIALLWFFKNYFGINLTDIPILNGVIGALSIFIFFFLQIIVSKGVRMGGGDLRIAILIGLALGTTLGFPGLMITYLVGSIVSIVIMITFHLTKTRDDLKFNSQIPFGPFLGIGFFVTLFFSTEITRFMNMYFNM